MPYEDIRPKDGRMLCIDIVIAINYVWKGKEIYIDNYIGGESG